MNGLDLFDIPPACGIGLDDPLRCLLVFHFSVSNAERPSQDFLRVTDRWWCQRVTAKGGRQGTKSSQMVVETLATALLNLRGGEVELKLLLLEGFSLQNATYSALSESSKGYLIFQGSGNIEKCFKIRLFCPSLIKICCPEQPAKLQFASALTIFILWAMDIFVVNPR